MASLVAGGKLGGLFLLSSWSSKWNLGEVISVVCLKAYKMSKIYLSPQKSSRAALAVERDKLSSFFAAENANFSTSANPAQWLLLNINVVGYFRVNYDLENWERLMNQLNDDLQVGCQSAASPLCPRDGCGETATSPGQGKSSKRQKVGKAGRRFLFPLGHSSFWVPQHLLPSQTPPTSFSRRTFRMLWLSFSICG